MSKNRIIPQMFDVRPVDEIGDLDWEKINSIGSLEQKDRQALAEERVRIEKEKERQRLLQIEKQNLFFKQQEEVRRQQEIQKKLELERKEQILKSQRLEKQQAYQAMINEEKKKAELQQEKLRFEQEERIRKEKEKHETYIAQEKLRLKQEKERILLDEKARLEIQQRQILERINNSYQEKQAAIIAEKERMKIERQQNVQAEILKRQEELKRISEQNRRKQEEYETFVFAEKRRREQEYAIWLQEELENQKRAEQQQAIMEAKIAKAEKKQQAKKRRQNGEIDANDFSWRDLFAVPNLSFNFETGRSLRAFVLVAILIFSGVGGGAFASRGIGLKGRVLGVSAEGMENLNLAVGDISNQNFESSTENFAQAYENFSKGSQELDGMGEILIEVARYVPFASKLSSGKNALETGKHFSAAGKSMNEVAKISAELRAGGSGENISLLDVFEVAQENISKAKVELDSAQESLDRINIDDLPEDKRNKFILVKQQLPEIRNGMDFFLNNSHILTDLLGGNGPRKYLFLFQNNSEMRATGGFIGSYGLLDISNGHIKKFFIDGIFNPDGQLRDKIVPPVPIQKISANWSMHDSNWFADFPTSAKKAISFYEKTGGPTADGVVTFTPTLMQKMLKITGPISMPEYDVTLDSENFIELTQNEVEVDYDKAENRPKKILSDLAPLVLEKLLSSKDLNVISQAASVLLDGAKEKHILFYSENAELQKIISEQGWSGEILPASKDYLSVINSNINGYKTDAVVKEKIQHIAEIQDDGSIIDSVSITRVHGGGNSKYEWFNKVNADYMRVYVPEGSKLLEVSGQTRQQNKPPLDYDALGFNRDKDVEKQESGISIDENSGTQIYNENGKTVFGNWTYVSPGETMTITYKYQLPFALFRVSVGDDEQTDSYSLVAQKQSGSVGSEFESTISYPQEYESKWKFPENLQVENQTIKNNSKLDTDRFVGVLFVKQ